MFDLVKHLARSQIIEQYRCGFVGMRLLVVGGETVRIGECQIAYGTLE